MEEESLCIESVGLPLFPLPPPCITFPFLMVQGKRKNECESKRSLSLSLLRTSIKQEDGLRSSPLFPTYII